MAVAATAPVESDGPVAVTQSPTARLDAVADSTSVTVVDAARATVKSDAGTVVVVVELAVRDLKPEPDSLTPSTTMDVDRADTSRPVMIVTLARRPPAKPEPVPAAKLRGGVLAGGGAFPASPLAPRANAPTRLAQRPDVEGWETATVRAVTVAPEVVPTTITQTPGLSIETVRVAVLENRVPEVQVTVSCPEVGFCTSIDDPVMAATEPDVPGSCAGPPPAADAGAVVGLLAVLAAPPPHAASPAARVTARAATIIGGRLIPGDALMCALFVGMGSSGWDRRDGGAGVGRRRGLSFDP